jgi:hypothetical protein
MVPAVPAVSAPGRWIIKKSEQEMKRISMSAKVHGSLPRSGFESCRPFHFPTGRGSLDRKMNPRPFGHLRAHLRRSIYIRPPAKAKQRFELYQVGTK